MSRVKPALVMFLFNIALVGTGFFWLSHIQSTNDQERCISISQIVSIPLPVPVAGNPAREWDAAYERAEREHGMRLGCKLPPASYQSGGPPK